MTYIQNTHHFRGFKIQIVEELTYEINLGFQDKILTNDALCLILTSALT
jgi:hypothetical protein